ncbi:MAG: HlyD family efflux transporter periplasmic adaptor subunit, partial [Pseudomonadota bacterium]
ELNARVAEFDAAIAAIDVALDKAVLHAPFDGEIGPRSVDPGQTVAGGTPVVRLLEAAAPQLRVGLPPEITQRLTPGTAVTAEIDGVTYAATLVQVRPDLDPTTRTQAAIFDLDLAGNPSPAFGAAGRVLVDVDVPDPGAWVPLDALRAGIDGTWTLYTVSDAGRIVPEGVEILHTDGTRAFVRGGFADDTLLVTGGAHRLAPGEPVRIQE